MLLKRIFAALAAVLVSASIAQAVITGTNSSSQDQQMAMGQTQIGAGTATGNSVTINNGSGVVTTAALSTAAGATQAITIANNRVAVGDQVQCTVDNNGSAGTPVCTNVRVTAGQIVATIQNIHAANALNSAILVYFWVNKAGNPN